MKLGDVFSAGDRTDGSGIESKAEGCGHPCGCPPEVVEARERSGPSLEDRLRAVAGLESKADIETDPEFREKLLGGDTPLGQKADVETTDSGSDFDVTEFKAKVSRLTEPTVGDLFAGEIEQKSTRHNRDENDSDGRTVGDVFRAAGGSKKSDDDGEVSTVGDLVGQ